MSNLILQAIGLAWILLLTIINWKWFKMNLKTGPLFHIIFGAIWLTPVFIVGWIEKRDIGLLCMFLLQRFVFFNPLLNIERGEKFFYLSTSMGKDSSWWDTLEIKYSKAYRDVWYISTGAYITLQFFIK